MLLKDKKALIFGVANERSIATGIARELSRHGARLAFSYASEPLKKRVVPINEELNGDFIFPCDVTQDEDIAAGKKIVQENWQEIDILIHSIAFAQREDLKGRFVDTSRKGFSTALDVSAYSLVALCQAYETVLSSNSSVIALTYFGSQKVVANYNVMGVAKAALEASVRYLAADMGKQGTRVNAISAGPIKTLAASGISGFKDILNKIEQRAPLGKNITQEDVGKSALFLASDLSSGTTGDVLYVDSGYNILGI